MLGERTDIARAEGKAEGERTKALDVARKLLHLLDDAILAQTTGLSVAEVAQLRHEQGVKPNR